jgi:hypothetical protein
VTRASTTERVNGRRLGTTIVQEATVNKQAFVFGRWTDAKSANRKPVERATASRRQQTVGWKNSAIEVVHSSQHKDESTATRGRRIQDY